LGLLRRFPAWMSLVERKELGSVFKMNTESLKQKRDSEDDLIE